MSTNVSGFVNSFNKENEIYQIQSVEIESYLKNIKEKYEKIKTFLHRTAPINVMDLFVMPTLSSHTSGSEKITIPNQIGDLLSISNKCVLVGYGGSGKSTLLRYLLLSALSRKKQIPIFFELHHYSDSNLKLIDNIFESIKNDGCQVNKETFKYGLKTGRFILFLDAIDEVKDRNKLIGELDELSDAPELAILLTSRPTGLSIGELSKYKTFNIIPYTQEQAISLINKLYTSSEDFYLGHKEKIIEYVRDNDTLLNNPLLISISVAAFDATHETDVFDKFNVLAETTINTLLVRHDATKRGYKRHISFSYDTLISACSEIGFITTIRGKYIFDEELIVTKQKRIENENIRKILFDLVELGILTVQLIKGKNEYSFIHRLIQIYFAMRYIMDCTDDSYKNIIELMIKNNIQGELLDNVYDTNNSRFALNIVYPAVLELEKSINDRIERYQQFFNIFIESIDVFLESKSGSSPNVYYIKLKLNLNNKNNDLLKIVIYFASRKLISTKSFRAHEIDKRVYNLMLKNKSDEEPNNGAIMRLDKKVLSDITIQSYLRSTIDVGQFIFFISNLKLEFEEIIQEQKSTLEDLFNDI